MLRGLPPGRYVVGATAPDGRWIVGQADAIAGRDVQLVLDFASTTPVQVRVQSRDDGAPIAGAVLDVLLEAAPLLSAKIPLRHVVPMPATDETGAIELRGLCRGQLAGIGAQHPSWRPMLTWNAPTIDWNDAAPHADVQLAPRDTVTWQLVDGDLPVPPDGTTFRVLETRVPLRGGRLHFDGQPLVDVVPNSLIARGPGCYSELRVPTASPGAKTSPAPVRRSRRLTIELRDDAGRPLADWPLWIGARHGLDWGLQTDSDGHAIVEDLPAELVTVIVNSGSLNQLELGKVDLTKSDGTLSAAVGPPRHVCAQVSVGGRRALPGRYSVRSHQGRVTNVDEDVERGTMSFDVWSRQPGVRLDLFLDTMPGLTTASAVVDAGSDVADVAFRVEPTSGGTVDVLQPQDGLCNVHVQRFIAQRGAGYWGTHQIVVGSPTPRLALPPGRYRLFDERSNVSGPEVEVPSGAPDALLSLDLSRVVSAAGRVAATPPYDRTSVEARNAAGTVVRQEQVRGDGSFEIRALAAPGTVLVAVRGDVSSQPVALTGPATDLVLVLPQ